MRIERSGQRLPHGRMVQDGGWCRPLLLAGRVRNRAPMGPLLAWSLVSRKGLVPAGTSHEIEGLLLERNGELVLDVQGGAAWRLDAGWRARRLLGRRVRVMGTRDGFDLLAVKTIKAA